MKRCKAMLTFNAFLIATVLIFVAPSEAVNKCLSCDDSLFERFVNCVANGIGNNQMFKNSASSLNEMKFDMLQASKAMKMKGSTRENAVKGMIAFELADLVERDESSDKKIAFIVNTLQRCYRTVYRSSDKTFFDECEKTIKIIVEDRKNTPDEQQPGDQIQPNEAGQNANNIDYAYADASAVAYNGPQGNSGKYPESSPNLSNDNSYADASATAYNGPQDNNGKYPKNSPGWNNDYADADSSATAYNGPQGKNGKYAENSPNWSNDNSYADASATAYNGPQNKYGKYPKNSPGWRNDYAYADASATTYNGPQGKSGKYPESSPNWSNDNSYADASVTAYNGPQDNSGKYPKNSPGSNNNFAYADASATAYNGPQDKSGKFPGNQSGWNNNGAYAGSSAIAYNEQQNSNKYNQPNSDSSQTQNELQKKKLVNALKFSETLYDKFYKAAPFWKVYHEYTLNYQAVSITYYALYKAMLSCGYSENLAQEIANNSIAFMKKFPEKSKTPSYAEAICKMTMVQFNLKDMIKDDAAGQANKLADGIIAVLNDIENSPTPKDNNSQPDVLLTSQETPPKDYQIDDGSDYEDYSVPQSSTGQQTLLVEKSKQNSGNVNKDNDKIDYSDFDDDYAFSGPQKWQNKKRGKKPKTHYKYGQFYDGPVQSDDELTKSTANKKGDQALDYNDNDSGYSGPQAEQIKNPSYAYNDNDQFSNGNSKTTQVDDDSDEYTEYDGNYGFDDYPIEDSEDNSGDLDDYSEKDGDLLNNNPKYSNKYGDYGDINPQEYLIPQSKKHNQPKIYNNDEQKKSKPFDIDQKTINTAPAEPELIKEDNSIPKSDKQTDSTSYDVSNISENFQNPKSENNAESKDRVKILMKWALDCMKDGKFDYPTYSSVIAALAKFVQQTHSEWPPQKSQTIVLMECIYALTQLLMKSDIKETKIVIQQPQKNVEPAQLPEQSNEPPIQSEPAYQPAADYPTQENNSPPNEQIQQKEWGNDYEINKKPYSEIQDTRISQSEPVLTNSAPQQNAPQTKAQDENWNVNNKQWQNNQNPFSVILNNNANSQQISQQPSAPEQVNLNQGNSNANAEAYSYSQTTDSNAGVPNINNYQTPFGNQINPLGFQKGINNPILVSNENQASYSYSESSASIPSSVQSTNQDFAGYQGNLSPLIPNNANNVNLAQNGYQNNGNSIAQSGFNNPIAAQDGNLGNWPSNGLNNFNLGQNTYQGNPAAVAQNGNRGNWAPMTTNGINNLNVGYQNGYQSNSAQIAQNGANNLNLAQTGSQGNWAPMTQNIPNNPNNQGNWAPSQQREMNSQNFMQQGNQGVGGASQQNAMRQGNQGIGGASQQNFMQQGSQGVGGASQQNFNPPNSFSSQGNQFNWG